MRAIPNFANRFEETGDDEGGDDSNFSSRPAVSRMRPQTVLGSDTCSVAASARARSPKGRDIFQKPDHYEDLQHMIAPDAT